MRPKFVTVATIPMILTQLCFAQEIQTGIDSKPASSNVVGQQYPQIDSELHATFRISAPDAQKVQFSMGPAQDMVKGEDGIWTITTKPLVPGFHYYTLLVDGARVSDPNSESFFGVSRMMSGIEVPEKGVDFYDAKDVPHGDVREKWYWSTTTNAWRRCYLYTPPDYDTNPSARYPVLYLQHGAGEDERGWSTQGHVNFILDNLIAAGKAKPMIIVMDNGGGSAAFAGGARGRSGPAASPGSTPAAASGGAAGTFPATGGNQPTAETSGSSATVVQASGASAPVAQAPADGGRVPGRGGIFNFTTFENVLINELIPMIDSTYRTIPDREHRAMAGLSMAVGKPSRSAWATSTNLLPSVASAAAECAAISKPPTMAYLPNQTHLTKK
jgi:hypothetical protein